MKTVTVIVLLILAALACGCTSQQPETPAALPAAEPEPPGLVGTWTGTTSGYTSDKGFTDFGSARFSLVVTEQQGRIIAGHTLLILNNTEKRNPVAGIIAPDGRTLSIVEEGNGYTAGRITGPDTIELTWMNDRSPASVALDTLVRA